MDKTESAIRYVEQVSKQQVFAIRPFDDEHPNLFLVNYSILVRCSDSPSVELLFRRRMNEYYFYQQAVSKRIPLPCPNILFYIPTSSAKAENFLDGPMYAESDDKEKALSVIDALGLLHQYHLDGKPFDVFERFYHYKKLTPNSLPASFENNLVKRMHILLDSSPHVLCHNDVKTRHIIFHEGRAFLLDFTTAGENAPIFDLASFFLDADLSPELIRECIERYYKVAGGRLYIYQEIFDAMSFLSAYDYYHYSALAKTSTRPLFASEAKKRKQRCLRLFEESLG